METWKDCVGTSWKRRFSWRATVEVASSSGKRKRLRRPLQNLPPLEFQKVGYTEQVPARPEANTFQRQRRNAAITGKVRRREVD